MYCSSTFTVFAYPRLPAFLVEQPDLRASTVSTSVLLVLSSATTFCLGRVSLLPLSSPMNGAAISYIAAAGALLLCGRIPALRTRAVSTSALACSATTAGTFIECFYILSHPQLSTLIIGALALKSSLLIISSILLVRAALRSYTDNPPFLPLYSSSQPDLPATLSDATDVHHPAVVSYNDDGDSDFSDDDDDDESSALLEKTFAHRDTLSRARALHLMPNGKSKETEEEEENVVYVDVDDDVARAMMRSGAGLRERILPPKLEIQVTVEVTHSYL